MYLYKHTIYKITDNVIGLNVTENNTNKTDFETTHKSATDKVTQIDLFETTYIVLKTYTDFEALITGEVTWADVKLIEDSDKYELNLISGS